jgi:hypothetical protein
MDTWICGYTDIYEKQSSMDWNLLTLLKVKVKLSLYKLWKFTGGLEVRLNSFLLLAMDVTGQPHAPDTLHLGKEPPVSIKEEVRCVPHQVWVFLEKRYRSYPYQESNPISSSL